MPRIAEKTTSRAEPLKREQLEQFEPFFQGAEQMLGFFPNDLLDLARVPPLLEAVGGMMKALFSLQHIPRDLTWLVSHVSSAGANCRYCEAHTAKVGEHHGVAIDKLKAACEFETSPLFSEAERSALRTAQRASAVPNAVTDEDFADLKKHFSSEAVVEIVFVISMFGFLNRWNSTMATRLEKDPLEFGETHLKEHGWNAGRHG